MVTAPYIVIDIETMSLSDEALKKEKALIKPDSRLKPLKKIKDESERMKDFERRKEESIIEKIEELKEDSALTDECQISVIGIKTPEFTMSFTSIPISQESQSIMISSGIIPVPGISEKDMMSNFCDVINKIGEPILTQWVGHNLGFDLPKIRLACVRNRVRMADILTPDQPKFDTSFMFAKYFSIRQQPFCSLKEVSYRLGISEETEKVIDGAEVPKLIEDGKVLEVCLYNAVDLRLTENAFKLLSNQF